jgi:hypothetical protein
MWLYLFLSKDAVINSGYNFEKDSLQGGGTDLNLLTGFKLKPCQYVSIHRPEVMGIYDEAAMAPQIVVKVSFK